MKVCAFPGCLSGVPQVAELAFQKNRARVDGFHHYCRRCQNSRMRATHEKRTLSGIKTVRAPVNESGPAGTYEQLQIARLKGEKSRLESQVKELEKMVLSADRLRDVIGTMGPSEAQSNPEWLKGANRQRSTHGTAVLFLSDIHFDEVVLPSQIGGCNEYNRDIAVSSLHNTFRNSIALLKGFIARPKYDGMVVALGGDLLSGNIHEELVESNEAPIQVSMRVLTDILIEGIGTLADEFKKIHVPCVTGNHGRMHKKPRAKNRAFENFEWTVYQNLATYFKRDSRVTFDVADGSDAFFNVYQSRFCLTHGDQFRGGDGIGGIMVPIMRGAAKKQVRQQAISDPFDVLMMGHWHQYIHQNRLVINGSVKGYDEYAYQNNFGFEPPMQALWVQHPMISVPTFRMPVLCRKGA